MNAHLEQFLVRSEGLLYALAMYSPLLALAADSRLAAVS